MSLIKSFYRNNAVQILHSACSSQAKHLTKRMLSIFASSGSLVEDAALKKWLNYIVKDKSKMAIKMAAIVYDNGNVAAATDKFRMSSSDFKEMKRMFALPEVNQMTFGGVTYCLKTRNPTQLVCFNGRDYIVVSKTHLTFIVATCQTKQKSAVVAEWLDTVAMKLRERRK